MRRPKRRKAGSTGPGKLIREVRKRLAISQEALSRQLGATKGAVQHWERGRNNPDFARLVALRRICPPGRERQDLDALLERLEALVSTGTPRVKGSPPVLKQEPRPEALKESPEEVRHRREHQRLDSQVEHLRLRVAETERRGKALESLVKQLLEERRSTGSTAPSGPALPTNKLE